MQHLILNLEAPLMAFGGETIDNYGVIRSFPASSMLTGLFANALGWRRVDKERHQRLQDRLVFAARIDREPAGGLRMTDFQTAQLGRNDRGWTTRGTPEGRAGGANTYNAPHLRYRDYFADMRVTVALRLNDAAENDDDAPILDDLKRVLRYPKRPLFIGRKPCLPSAPLFGGFSEGDACLAALLHAPLAYPEEAQPKVAMQWPDGEDKGVDLKTKGFRLSRSQMLTDERNWVSGLHGGGRLVHESTLPKECFGNAEASCEQKEEQQ